MDKVRFVCDPNKGQECSSSAVCFKNGGTCYITESPYYAASPVSTVVLNDAYDKLVMRLLHERVCTRQIAEAHNNASAPKPNVLATLGILGVVE